MRRTDTRDKVYDFICDYIKTHGYAPSVRDISDGMGIGLSTAHFHMKHLKEDGRITFDRRVSRSIVLT